MKKIYHLFLFLYLIPYTLYLSSCHCKKGAIIDSPRFFNENDYEKKGYVKATVINYEVDGCTFLLKLSDERKLEPTNLSTEFKKDRLAVWIKHAPKKDAVSACMAGTIVELSDIQIRK